MAWVAALCGLPEAAAAKIAPQAPAGLTGTARAQFDSQSRQTHVAGQAGSDLCFSLALPQEWRSTTEGPATRVKSVQSGAELTLTLRAADELRDRSQPDLTSRDAALLQQDYETLLGRPAQSVHLASFSARATRWSATWIDANLPGGPMTVEAFIVPLSAEWILELALTDVTAKEEYDGLVVGILAALRVEEGAGCGRRTF